MLQRSLDQAHDPEQDEQEDDDDDDSEYVSKIHDGSYQLRIIFSFQSSKMAARADAMIES